MPSGPFLSNLFRPWLLARLATAATATVLLIVGVFVALRVLRYFRVSRTSEGQLALERRAELTATLVQAALWGTVLGLGLTVLAADRMTPQIRGAMCAYGVLDASPWGLRSLAFSAIAALACGAWLALHRFDLSLRTPALTRMKFAALLAVAPLVLLDLVGALLWTLDLDLRVIATCCSTGLDAPLSAALHDDGGLRSLSVSLAAGGGLATILLALALRARPSALLSRATALTSTLAALAAVPAIAWYVAPHAYESPQHLCPFCLLRADTSGTMSPWLSWPLFVALFAALLSGASLLVVAWAAPIAKEPEPTRLLTRTLAARTAAAWAIALCLASYPVIRFAVSSGGASLFG